MAIESSIDIQAPVKLVWELTCDVEKLPELNPTFRSARWLNRDKPLGVGSKIRLKQPLQPALIWTVTHFEEPTLFVWATQLLGVTMTASHILEHTDGGCRNNLSVELTGRGSGLFERLGGFLIRRAITTENRGFKTFAEKHS